MILKIELQTFGKNLKYIVAQDIRQEKLNWRKID